jgi:hypothetical protein
LTSLRAESTPKEGVVNKKDQAALSTFKASASRTCFAFGFAVVEEIFYPALHQA